MHHEFMLFLLLVAFSLLVIGRGQFSNTPSAVYWSSSKSAMVILIAGSSSLFGDETGDKFFDRFGAIVLAGAILAAGLPLAAYLFPARSSTAASRSNGLLYRERRLSRVIQASAESGAPTYSIGVARPRPS